jgi:hypothetical protein
MAECPECHHATNAPLSHEGASEAHNNGMAGGNNMQQQGGAQNAETAQQNGGSRRGLIVAIAVLLAVILGGYVYYSNFASDSESDAYEFAMKSDDPEVLQNYLDSFKDAPEAHRDSIEAHLLILQQCDKEWTNALISNSKSALESYLENHPDSPHKEEALHKIDSIDWAEALSENTLESMREYLEEHPNGEHVDEANDGVRAQNAKTVQPAEQQMVKSLFSTFFRSINNKDEDALISTVNNLLTSFLGKSDATRSDVATFMRKIYKDDVESMTWRLADDYKISKKEVGDEKYEYSVSFSALQDVKLTNDSEKRTKYRVSAKVNPDGRITEMNMTKILE